ncbi:flagellar basal body rod protein FlgB [Peptococcaceae bacterium CEB3]|nr:flagellar basal body rod protein FlgB [Peptococcaceae bacterium CEB3]
MKKEVKSQVSRQDLPEAAAPMNDWLNTPVLRIMEKGLDASSLRQRVLANNVANVDTPGFKRSDVNFQVALESALGQSGVLPLKETLAGHLAGTQSPATVQIKKDSATSLRNDGNNVDIDKEMADVAKNGLYYDSVSQAIQSQLGILRKAIQGQP